MQTREEIIAGMRAMHNHICIVHDHQLARLIGFHEDAQDVYYHVVRMNAPMQERNDYFASYVGACVSLQGVERYDRIDAMFALNGAPPSVEFVISRSTQEDDVAMYGEHAVRDHGEDEIVGRTS